MIRNPNFLVVQAQRNILRRQIEIYIVKGQRPDSKIAAPLEFVPMTEELHDPSVSLGFEEAQELMDELWHCGVRPTEVGSPGELGAVKNHLSDMKSIANRLLDDKLKAK